MYIRAYTGPLQILKNVRSLRIILMKIKEKWTERLPNAHFYVGYTFIYTFIYMYNVYFTSNFSYRWNIYSLVREAVYA